MIIQGVALFGCTYTINKLWNKDKRELKKLWKEIMRENNLFNEKGLTYNLAKIESTEYGYLLIVGIPTGWSYKELDDKRHVLESCLKGILEMDYDKFNGWIRIRVIQNPLKDLKFEPIKTKPHELYLGYTYYKHIIADMNVYPHLLIAGINGSGKTRGLYCILTNLFYNHSDKEIEAYMSQIGKTDLFIYRSCPQVKFFSRNTEDSLDMYKKLNNELKNREEVIEKLMGRGIYNIEDYNKKIGGMKYIYVISDEFSLYMPDQTDSKDEKMIKEQCLDILKKLIKLGRAYGIFVIMSLQKTTNDQMPQLLKSQVNCKVCFKQTDVYSSRNMLDNDEALELERREAIAITGERFKIKTPYIDDTTIKNYLPINNTSVSIKVDLKPKHEVHPDGIIRRGTDA